MKVKRKLIQRSAIGLIVGLIILLMVTQYSSTKAEKYPPVLRSVEENIPGIANTNFVQERVDQTLTNVDDIEKMLNEWKMKKSESEQWLHIVYTRTSDMNNGVILPNGEPMPSSYIEDDWYYINKEGLVEKGVFSMEDAEGNTFQRSAFQNNIMINFTFGDRQEDVNPFPVSVDFGYMNQIKEANSLGLEIRRSYEEQKGLPRIVFTYVENLQEPTQMGNEEDLVDSITVKGYFDEITGDFIQLQTIWTLDNGAQVNFEVTEIVRMDYFSKAPAEVLTMLESVK